MSYYNVGDVVDFAVSGISPSTRVTALVIDIPQAKELKLVILRGPKWALGLTYLMEQDLLSVFNRHNMVHPSKINLAVPIDDKWIADIRAEIGMDLDNLSYGDLGEYDIDLPDAEPKPSYDFATSERPYDKELVEEKSGIPAENFVDFSNIDLLTGEIKR